MGTNSREEGGRWGAAKNAIKPHKTSRQVHGYRVGAGSCARSHSSAHGCWPQAYAFSGATRDRIAELAGRLPPPLLLPGRLPPLLPGRGASAGSFATTAFGARVVSDFPSSVRPDSRASTRFQSSTFAFRLSMKSWGAGSACALTVRLQGMPPHKHKDRTCAAGNTSDTTEKIGLTTKFKNPCWDLARLQHVRSTAHRAPHAVTRPGGSAWVGRV